MNNTMSKKLYIFLSTIVASVMMSSCVSRGNNAGWEYAPDMYYSKGYEPYSQVDSNKINPYGMNMREPVPGTIAIGKLDYQFGLENNGDGYEASIDLKAPTNLSYSDGQGKHLFEIYCVVCHGKLGNNDGEVFKKVPTLKPGAWKAYTDTYIRELPQGKIYHTLTYGKNNMGSHASVLTPSERWKVIDYVKQLSRQVVPSAPQMDIPPSSEANKTTLTN